MYQPDASGGPQLMTIGQSFQQLVNRLEQAQVEYDLGSEDIIARHGSVTAAATATSSAQSPALFVVGQRAYHTVVLPAHTENLNSPTAKLIEQFLAAGGRVLCAATRRDSWMAPRPSDCKRRRSTRDGRPCLRHNCRKRCWH